MKISKFIKNIFIASLFSIFVSSSMVSNQSNASNENIQQVMPQNVKRASAYPDVIYKLPTNWLSIVQSGLKESQGGSYTDAGTITTTYVTKIGFFGTSEDYKSLIGYNSHSYSFYHNASEYYDVMVAINNYSTKAPTILTFYGSGYKNVIFQVEKDTAYFDSLKATTFVFNSFKFTSYSQYQTVMAGSKATSVSGSSLPTNYESISNLKSVLNTCSSTSNYSSITSIKFKSDSTSLSGYKDTGYTLGSGVKLYVNSSDTSDIIIYSSSTITAPSDMSSLFSGFTSLKTIEFDNLNTSNTTNFSSLFNGCSSLTSLDLSSLNMSKASNVSSMLNSCTSLTEITTPTNISSSVTISLPSNYYDKTTNTDNVTTITSSNTNHTLIKHTSHSLTKVEAKAATCSTQGNEEYYTCSICGNYYSDSEGKTKLDSIPYTNKLEHTIEVTNIALNDAKNSATISLKCTRDDEDLGTVESTSIEVSETKPTCTGKGEAVYTISYQYAGKDYQTTYKEDINPTGHSLKYEVSELSSNEATINVICENEDNKVIDTTTSTNITSTTTKEATYTEKGEKTYTIKFTYDGKEQEVTYKEEIDKLPDVVSYSCILGEDKKSGQIKVTHKDGSQDEYITANVSSTITKEATCDTDGLITYTFTATYNGKQVEETYTEVIKAKGHSFSFDIEINSESEATVTVKCNNEDEKILGVYTSEVTKTVDENGNEKYSISVNDENGVSKSLDVTDKVNQYKQRNNQNNNTDQDQNDKSSSKMIFFIVTGIILLLVFIYLLGYFNLYKKRKLDKSFLRFFYCFLPKDDIDDEEIDYN